MTTDVAHVFFFVSGLIVLIAGPASDWPLARMQQGLQERKDLMSSANFSGNCLAWLRAYPRGAVIREAGIAIVKLRKQIG